MEHSIDISQTTITLAASLIREGGTTAAKLMAAVLERVAATEPSLHAYAYLDENLAMDSALNADREFTLHGPRGPLHGIPIGIKDLIETADMPTEAGSAVLQGNRPKRDAPAVRKLREAGAIILGKQHTHEFGFGNDEPPTKNPWDNDRYAGGSTAGGGASVAVGSSLAALGTDGGGSIRKPAAINGLVGLKPSLGHINTDGIVPGPTSVDHIGWLTRSVADAALMLSVLGGGSGGLESPTGISGLRLGCASYFFEGLDSEVELHIRQCLEVLSQAGVELIWFDLPELESAVEIHGTIASFESYMHHADLVRSSSNLYHPVNLRMLTAAAGIGEAEIRSARGARLELQLAMEKALNDHNLDALCSPTIALPAVPLPEMKPEIMLPKYCRLTVPFNLTGQPAISVPCGLDGRGLPVGFQIAGRLEGEAVILRIAEAIEAAHLWTQPRSIGAVAPHGVLEGRGKQDTFVNTRL